LRVIAGDESHPAHIGGERVYLVDLARGLLAVAPATQIKKLKLIGVRGAEFGIFQIRAPHPIASLF
jgi:hypothetical protein